MEYRDWMRAKRWKGEDCFDRCICRMFPEYIREKLNYEEGTIRSIPQPPFCALAIVERNYYSTATFLRPLPGQTNFVSRSELQIRTLFMYYGSVVFGRPPPDSWMKFNWSTPLPKAKNHESGDDVCQYGGNSSYKLNRRAWADFFLFVQRLIRDKYLLDTTRASWNDFYTYFWIVAWFWSNFDLYIFLFDFLDKFRQIKRQIWYWISKLSCTILSFG